MKKSFTGILIISAVSSMAGTAWSASEYSPNVGASYPNRVLFGDTHLHSSYSTDAGMIGNRLGPEEALRFAMGEEVTSSTGVKAKLARPLDFLVIADHAENLGLAPAVAEQSPELLSTDFGKQLMEKVKAKDPAGAYWLWQSAMNIFTDPLAGMSFSKTMWQRLTTAVEKYNQPGRFTALIGFEWTSMPGGNNLHRNIIFRDGKSKADEIVPISQYDTRDPEDLWKWMEAYEAKTGGALLAIPHNGNLSNGLMFDDRSFTSKAPLDADYAKQRTRWEPVYEVTQMKGDGEAHPSLSPSDEFAGFETWDKGSFGTEAKTPAMLPREYARAALKRGLAYEAKLGVNPFKFGMIGSTDAHTSLATSEENNFFGKVALLEPSANTHYRFDEPITGRGKNPEGKMISNFAWQTSASGLAAVWVRENTREAIWDALKRKEVYATTGTRLEVRVFAGNFTPADLTRADWVANAYAKGVPMGGDLKVGVTEGNPRGTGEMAPSLLIKAARSADGANLDRIQVIKGWLAKDGTQQEKVYDVAWSGSRKPGKNGKLPAVGNTVDVKNATYSNSIGAPVLETYWKDPGFKPSERAFYYVRVLEIPTPRWTTYDAKVFGTTPPKAAPTSIQDRAYTSPIWYSPS